MNKVGLDGGSSLCELGTAKDVIAFFYCVDKFVVNSDRFSEVDFKLLTDRLYRRYIRQEELGRAEELMLMVRDFFCEINYSDVDWSAAGVDFNQTLLEFNCKSLADIFSSFFVCFSHCSESAAINYEAFKAYSGYVYEPVRIIISDLPEYFVEKNRTLDEYDKLSGLPFWQQNN